MDINRVIDFEATYALMIRQWGMSARLIKPFSRFTMRPFMPYTRFGAREIVSRTLKMALASELVLPIALPRCTDSRLMCDEEDEEICSHQRFALSHGAW